MKEKISILLIGFMLMFSGCGKQDVQVYYWDNEGNDVLTSKMKTDRQSENGFVRNFLETYNADMETKEELLEKYDYQAYIQQKKTQDLGKETLGIQKRTSYINQTEQAMNNQKQMLEQKNQDGVNID